MSIKLNVILRNAGGKGATRNIRKSKNIPAVIYGMGIEPLSIEVAGKDFEPLIKKHGLRTKLFEINVNNKTENVMLVDIQYHPVSDAVMHIDFKRVDVNKNVSVNVPIELINTEISKGVKLGGTLNFSLRKVLLIGLIKDMPETIKINCENLNLGDSIKGSDLILPENIKLGLNQSSLTFITITGKLKEEKVEAAADTAKAKPKK